jgi:hypothetical protein
MSTSTPLCFRAPADALAPAHCRRRPELLDLDAIGGPVREELADLLLDLLGTMRRGGLIVRSTEVELDVGVEQLSATAESPRPQDA